MAVLSFPVLMFVCVFIPCMALILTWGGGPFLTYASASFSLASPSVRRLYPKSSKWPPFLSSQILPVTLTSIRGEKKQHQIVGSELTCVSQHRQQCSVWVWALTSNTDPLPFVSPPPDSPHSQVTRKVIDRLCLKNGSPAVFAVVMLTSHGNGGFKHFFKLCLIFFCLFIESLNTHQSY